MKLIPNSFFPLIPSKNSSAPGWHNSLYVPCMPLFTIIYHYLPLFTIIYHYIIYIYYMISYSILTTTSHCSTIMYESFFNEFS